MRVLFYFTNGANRISGGVENVTLTLAESLKDRYGYELYLICSSCRQPVPEGIFSDILDLKNHLDESLISGFVNSNRIDIVINQGNLFLAPMLRHIQLETEHRFKIVFCLHSANDFFYSPFSYAFNWVRLRYSSGFKEKVKNGIYFLLAPMERFKNKRRCCALYNGAVGCSDKVVLLTETAIDEFLKMSSTSEPSKVTFINNPFRSVRSRGYDPSKKEKNVLFVGRFEEYSKKLSLALRAWNLIENKYEIKDWTFTVLGDGEARPIYENMVRKLKLNNVRMLGTQVPDEYYSRSSILALTSASEGMPMVLFEAADYGCVPVVFDKVDTFREVLEDGVNGIVVKYPDVKAYAAALVDLMKDGDKLGRLSSNVTRLRKKYSIENISSRWHSLLTDLARDE